MNWADGRHSGLQATWDSPSSRLIGTKPAAPPGGPALAYYDRQAKIRAPAGTGGAADMSTEFDRITIDPEQMNGQPCIRGMRLTVRRVV
jgi:hypothetical protein